MKSKKDLFLSIIIPVYNESHTIKKILKKVSDVDLPIKKEIIIVDDCSEDKSLEKIKNTVKNKKEIRVIKHKKNRGKGAALKTGIENSKGNIIGIQDADLEYDPEDYKKLIKPIIKEKAKVVYGSRFLRKKRKKKNKFYYANKFLSLLTSLLYLTRITDMETCYKFFRKEVLKGIRLKSKRFDIEPEITSKILKKGYKIHEIPIKYSPRTRKQGKKIGIKDGFEAILTLLKYRFI